MHRFVATAKIDGAKIRDWPSFHSEFADVFGFPSFYGRNMNAWVDCMRSLDVPEEGLSGIHCRQGQVMTIHLLNAKDFMERCPEQYATLIECSSLVNWERITKAAQPISALAFHATRVA